MDGEEHGKAILSILEDVKFVMKGGKVVKNTLSEEK
jgi:hypothetical protein